MGKEHADHLISVLEQHYKVAKDWSGERYGGIKLDWDYTKRKVHLSMPSYCKEALFRFNHVLGKLRHQPHKHPVPTYGATAQYAKEDDASSLLSGKENKFVQQVTGTFLFLRQSSGQHNAGCLECNCTEAGGANTRDNGEGKTVS